MTDRESYPANAPLPKPEIRTHFLHPMRREPFTEMKARTSAHVDG